MKQVYIIKKNNPKLLLFFAGWAADETPFKQYCPQGMDYMICYDYRTLDFDTSILEQYRQVNVVAWSMGVWAAPIALASVPKEKLLLIAFNGTITPIGDTDGIPEKTFRDTLSGLTPASLQKFMRRMCKDSNAYKAFLAITPRRDFNEIKEELELIEKKYTQMRGITIDENGNYIYSNDDEMDTYVNNKYQYIDYDYAFIGVNDRIFPLENMKLNFDYMFDDDKLIVADCAHYDEPMFRFLLHRVWSIPTPRRSTSAPRSSGSWGSTIRISITARIFSPRPPPANSLTIRSTTVSAWSMPRGRPCGTLRAARPSARPRPACWISAARCFRQPMSTSETADSGTNT